MTCDFSNDYSANEETLNHPPSITPLLRGAQESVDNNDNSLKKDLSIKDGIPAESNAGSDMANGDTNVPLHEEPFGSDKINMEPPSNDPNLKGKGKKKDQVDEVDRWFYGFRQVTMMPPRPPPGPRGQGRHLDEDFFHRVPFSRAVHDKRRDVFCGWPRDPNGPPLALGALGPLGDAKEVKPIGKVSPDGYPWGETLYDIFVVKRTPAVQGRLSVVTGSALLITLREIGELDVARSEIEWAKTEGEPRDMGVADTAELIMFKEWQVKRLAIDPRTPEPAKNAKKESHCNACANMEVDPAPVLPPPEILVTSPFHPSHYPAPWPLTPFRYPQMSVLLQERIPPHLLPKKLYVHDPFDVLTLRTRRFHNTLWTSQPDRVRTYNLTLSRSMHKDVEEAQRKAEEIEEFKARMLVVLRYKRTEEQVKNNDPIIEVPLPAYPRRLAKVEESHLYISPATKIGVGNHSIVYKGEWELPRDLFIRPTICPSCFKEDLDKEIQRLKDTGQWNERLKKAGLGSTSFTGEPSQQEAEMENEPVDTRRDQINDREVICVVPPYAPPMRILEFLEEKDVMDELLKDRHQKQVLKLVEDENDEHRGSTSTTDTRSVIIRINAPVAYNTQRICAHDSRHLSVPRTARFTVVAKLSLEGDRHLVREARNYQQFPEHFFRHYNGYTIFRDLHAVVPVGAVVPQFYGYYTPEAGGEPQGQPYVSPILLLEHCGKPISPDELSLEDQEECASLLLRFQNSGWVHESFAARNFLVQHRRPTEFPSARHERSEPSFRLIDFGRSRKYTTAEEKRQEEEDVIALFRDLHGRMKITLEL